ncbi:phytanoyl-CoA dioxygenase family protein [Massilia suwonensis]|uniref:Phytanoyl-CoA dioxygenase family protein n=1 Tax=Massilia suwonensis TaxID=648895 RepID=A0ABW0MEQ2_9BURK
MNTNPHHYGIQNVNQSTDMMDHHIEEIRNQGYTIVDGGFSDEELKLYSRKLDLVYEAQKEEVGGEENLTSINDDNVVRCPLAYDDAFLNLATHSSVMTICERILGSNFVLLMQNGVINDPDKEHYQTRWHRDLNYQHWVSSQPLALSALLCMDTFSELTGGTRVLPGSHLKETFPSDAYVTKHEQTIEAPAGSILVMDAMLFHCAGRNLSNALRRALNHVVGVPILSQQLSIPDMLQGKHKNDPFLEKYLGYRWQPKSSVKEWRLEKLAGARKHA